MRYLRFLFVKGLVILFLLASFIIFLFTTTPGLYFTTRLAKWVVPGELLIEQPEGRFFDHLSFATLSYNDKNITLKLKNLQLKWRWKALLHRQLFIDSIEAKEIDLIKKNSQDKSNFTLPKINFSVIINQAKIDEFNFDKIEFDHLDFQAKINNEHFEISHLNFEVSKVSFALQSSGQSTFPYALTANLEFHFDNYIKGSASFKGDYSLYDWAGEIKNPINFRLKGSLKNGQELQSHAEWKNFVWPLTKNLPLTSPEGRLDIQGIIPNLVIQGDWNMAYYSSLLHLSFNYQNQQIKGQLRLGKNQCLIRGKPPLGWQLTATLPEPSLLHPSLEGLQTPFSAKASLTGQANHWSAEGTILSQGQPLHLIGKGDISPEASGTLHINATHFPLINTSEYKINLSPKLVFSFSPKLLEMKGSILVPDAEIKPKTFNNTVDLSSDVVFVGKTDTSSTTSSPMKTDILIEMGSQVALSVKGLKGHLNGAIHLRQEPPGPLTASGELSIRDGVYKAYGENLTIDQGALLFTGSSILNPNITVRASRRFNNLNSTFANTNQLFDFNSSNVQSLYYGENARVGIQVSGRLKSPKITLFSEPSNLSQADILSMLILGKPARDANKAGGQLLLKAITSMDLGSGTEGNKLLEQLKSFDVDLQTNSKFNQETNKVTESKAVVVGKSLSKRIYLSYNFGLAQSDANVVTLTYLLNKFFSIQVNASVTASGIDVLYTRKKKGSQ